MLQVGQLRQRREDRKHEEVRGFKNQNTNPSSEAQESGFLMPLVRTPAQDKERAWRPMSQQCCEEQRSLGFEQRAPGCWVWGPGDQRQWRGQWPLAVMEVSVRASCINLSRHCKDRGWYPGRGQDRAFHRDQMLICCKAWLTFRGKKSSVSFLKEHGT